MTMTMTLTEFNQNPSRASRLAEQGDVRVTRRGEPYLRLVRDETPITPETPDQRIDRLIREGKLDPPKVPPGTPLKPATIKIPRDVADAIIADFEAERYRDYWGLDS